MKAVTESTLAAPATHRDVLARLLHDIITSPNARTRSHTQACATIAQAFAWLDQSDARLAVRHSALRENALVTTLAEALQIVERHDLGWAITIASSLTASVAPLSGEPINLVVGTACVFGAGRVHRGGA